MDGINWGELLQPLIGTILGVLGTLASAVLVQLLRKYGIELKSEQQQAIDAALRIGALKAEEIAASTLKRTGHATPSAIKRDMALSTAEALVPKVAPSVLADRLESVLPTVGVGAAVEASGKPPAEPKQ